MKNKITKSAFKIILFLFAVIIGIAGCTEDPEETLYRDDLIGPDYPPPVIESVNPPEEALAGVTEITITGQNFSPNAGYNLVFFDSELGDIISATGSEIVVRAPLYADTSIDLKVAVRKVEDFSNVYQYKLNPAVFETGFNTMKSISDVAVNNDGVLFLIGNGKINKILPDGNLEFYSNISNSAFPAIKFGPDNQIFFVLIRGSATAFLVIPEGGGAAEQNIIIGAKLRAFDFDSQGNIWAGSETNGLYYITYPEGNITEFPFNYWVSDVKTYEGYLYVAASDRTADDEDTEEAVWRFPINNSILGEAEKYFDFSSNFPESDIESFIFSADGDLYLSTSNDKILVVYPDKTSEFLYENQIVSPILSSLVWGAETQFYYISGEAFDNILATVDVEKEGSL